jgi:hypothetical protein
MSDPKLHHYVPQFYLRRFRDKSGRLWAWDREEDRVLHPTPRSVAAERSFYYLDLYADEDPLAMEKQFARLEYDVARITTQWIEWIRDGDTATRIPLPDPNRELVSLFIALQFLRTADSRDILSAFASDDRALSKPERRTLHTEALWNDDLVHGLADYVHSAIWMFGRNATEVPFITSDNPVAFRTPDHAMWLKTAILGSGAYVVYPLAPDIVMYCYPREAPWLKLVALDSHVSPIPFTPGMVESENTAQVFMASRFVISRKNDFAKARAFAKTIGTDAFGHYWRQGEDTK